MTAERSDEDLSDETLLALLRGLCTEEVLLALLRDLPCLEATLLSLGLFEFLTALDVLLRSPVFLDAVDLLPRLTFSDSEASGVSKLGLLTDDLLDRKLVIFLNAEGFLDTFEESSLSRT